MAIALVALVLSLAACGPKPVEMFQPPADALRGAVYVHSVEISFGGESRDQVAEADRKLHGAGDAALPMAKLLDQDVTEATRAHGLRHGRPLTIALEMDVLRIPDVGMAVLGRSDRLAGQVRVEDAKTGEHLALFYVTVDHPHSGLIGLAVRGGSVREKLAREFAERIAEQLAAKRR